MKEISKIDYIQLRVQELQHHNESEEIAGHLIVLEGGDVVEEHQIPLFYGANLVGGTIGNSILLRGRGVSTFHAIIQIEREPLLVFIEDLQSTNGTTISAVKSKQDEFKLIPKRLYQVLDGQSITFGPTSTILKISDSNENIAKVVPLHDSEEQQLASIHIERSETQSNIPQTKQTTNQDIIPDHAEDAPILIDTHDNPKSPNDPKSPNNSIIPLKRHAKPQKRNDEKMKKIAETNLNENILDPSQTKQTTEEDLILDSAIKDKNRRKSTSRKIPTKRVSLDKKKEEPILEPINNDSAQSDPSSLKENKELNAEANTTVSIPKKESVIPAKPKGRKKKDISKSNEMKENTMKIGKNTDYSGEQLTGRSRRAASNKANINTIRVLISVNDQAENLKKIVKKLGGEQTDSPELCTHFITDKVKRTVKFLCCLSLGKYIVSPEWLHESLELKSFADPMQYIIKDPEGEQKFNFNLKTALSSTMKESSQKLLSNYVVYTTMSVQPLPEELRKIVSAAGGLLVVDPPKEVFSKNQNFLVVGNSNDWNECLHLQDLGYTIYSIDLILNGILRQSLEFSEFSLNI